MPNHPFILYPSTASWRLTAADSAAGATTLNIEPGASPAEIAAAVAADLNRLGYGGEAVLLAIPSAWCLCGSISTVGLPPRNRHRAMTYRLEEKLPMAAEEVVVDFLPSDPSDTQALGVAAETKLLAPMVGALESAGVAIAMICPAALLAVQQVLRDDPVALASVDAIVLTGLDVGRLDLLIIRAGLACGCHLLPAIPRDLSLHLAVAFRGRAGFSVAAGSVSREVRAAIAAIPAARLVDVYLPDAVTAATSMARSALAGKALPWINLRRDALAVSDPVRQVRSPLRFALAASVTFLLCLFAAMLWRANRYHRLARDHLDQEQAVFREAFPSEVPPADVLSRLASEERRLHGLRGDVSAPARQRDGLLALRDLITHLPATDQLHYRVLELRLDPDRFTLEGQARAHRDADVIATSIRKEGMFSVEPPRTEQLGGRDRADASGDAGVSFTVSGAVMHGPDGTR